MKKHLTFFFFLFIGFSISAQSLVVTGDTLIAGDACIQLTSHLSVANQSNKTIDVRCRIIPLNNTGVSNAPPAEFSFCWGGACYGSGIDTSGLTTTIAAGNFVEFPDVPAHSGYFDAFCNASSGEIQYCFYDDANPLDETCFKVSFDATTTAVEDKFTSEKLFNFFPNPSNEYTHIFYNESQECIVEIVDILGNLLKTTTLNEVGQQKIFIGDLPNGMYFGRFTVNGNLLAIKKLIVKR